MKGDFDSERQRMVEFQLVRRGIRDPRVLEAFGRVPRHEFVPEALKPDAYRDSPLPIGSDQTISQPYMVAAMTAAAEIQPTDRVLEIGTGSGYQAAILAELAAEVYTIERRPELAGKAREVLQRLGYHNIHFRVANGTLGWPEEAPFDAIIVTAGAPEVPHPLKEQLAEKGRLVIPVEDPISHVLYVIRRTQGGFLEERRERCSFVPLIGKHGRAEG